MVLASLVHHYFGESASSKEKTCRTKEIPLFSIVAPGDKIYLLMCTKDYWFGNKNQEEYIEFMNLIHNVL